MVRAVGGHNIFRHLWILYSLPTFEKLKKFDNAPLENGVPTHVLPESLKIGSLAEYAIRRYVRIAAPMLVAVVVAIPIGVDPAGLYDGIFWSLFAELIYYTLYPGLLCVRRRVMWRWMITAAYAAAIGVAATDPGAGNYPSYGVGLNWLIGLPCWLLGCELAEIVRTDVSGPPGRATIWGWRLGVWFASFVCSSLRCHSPLGYPWTLNVFALLVAAWLLREIRYYRLRPPPRLLEWAGAWSYSLYITHFHGLALYCRWIAVETKPLSGWVMMIGVILVTAYGFYLIVELPSHRLARYFGRLMRPKIAGDGLAEPVGPRLHA